MVGHLLCCSGRGARVAWLVGVRRGADLGLNVRVLLVLLILLSLFGKFILSLFVIGESLLDLVESNH